MTGSTAYFLAAAGLLTVGLLALLRAADRLVPVAPKAADDAKGSSTARALLLAGEVVGVLSIARSVTAGAVHGESLASDALWASVYGVVALVAYLASARLGVRVLLRSSLPQEIARGNVSAGLAAGAHHAATGLVVGSAMSGAGLATLGVSVAFFTLGQLSLHLLVGLFRALTAYDDDEEILDDNVAAAASYAGLTVAVGILVAHAVDGPFTGWAGSLQAYGIALGLGAGLWPVRQLVVQGLLLGMRPTLRGGPLDAAISRDRAFGLGFVEAAAYVATALLLAGIW